MKPINQDPLKHKEDNHFRNSLLKSPELVKNIPAIEIQSKSASYTTMSTTKENMMPKYPNGIMEDAAMYVVDRVRKICIR